MATRARFGRLPRSAPSLTSTIVQLAQQYQSTRDRNIETAWKEGGRFEGKKVTDEAFLKHWQSRLDGVSHDDPMWDYYNNLVYSYNFMIEESKMGLKYAEEKVSDGEMAAFYRKWAAKMPVNSQNYRQLMTQAAKFKAAATSRGYGRRSNAAAEAYNKAQAETYNKYEAPYDIMRALISEYAVGRNILDRSDVTKENGESRPDYGWGKLVEDPGSQDAHDFEALLTDLMDDDPARERITAYIRANGDPNFSGTFNEETIVGMAGTARTGASIRVNRGRKAGDAAGVKAAQKAQDQYSRTSMVIRLVVGPTDAKHDGFIAENEKYRAEMDDVLRADSGATPQQRADAIQRYGTWLNTDGKMVIARSFPSGAFDPTSKNYNQYAQGFMGRVNGTLSSLAGKPTGPTLKDDTLGFGDSEAGESSDAVTLAQTSAGLQQNLADVASGKAIVVRSDVDGKPNPTGKSWSVYDRDDPDLSGLTVVPFVAPAGGTHQFTNGSVLGGDDGELLHAIATKVRGKMYGASDPRTGGGVMELKPSDMEDDVLGERVEIPGPDGQMFTQYGVWKGGQQVWTYVDPFATVNRGNEGIDDETGDYLISYTSTTPVAEGTTGSGIPRYSPGDLVHTEALKMSVWVDGKGRVDPTDGSAWEDSDRESAWNSPWYSFANTSSANMTYLASLGDKAIKNVEKEWYSKPEHWTPKMNEDYRKGVPPDAIVEDASNRLVTAVQSRRYWGAPEDQDGTRKVRDMMQQKADAETAARLGVSLEDYRKDAGGVSTAAQRRDLASQLTKWGMGAAPDPTSSQNIQRASMGMGPTPRTQTKLDEWAKKGWTVGDLVNQPGMTLDQANDLVYQITGGSAGHPIAPTVIKGPPAGMAGGTGNRSKPYVNPYLTPARTVPKRYVAPKDQPKPPEQTEVNAATGFTVPKQKTVQQKKRTTYKINAGGGNRFQM